MMRFKRVPIFSMSNESNLWQQLQHLAVDSADISISELFADSGRVSAFSITLDELYFDFSKHRVTPAVMEQLLALAEDIGVIDQAKAMSMGAMVNPTESRPALHMALRRPNPALNPPFIDHIFTEREKLKDLSQQIRTGLWLGVTGKPITDVINIGIGGSDLGPRMACSALREYHDGPRVHFISNVDGAEIKSLLPTLDAERTLIIISSKSFTTQETMLNAATALDWLKGELNHEHPQSTSHCIAITSNTDRASAFGIADEQMLTFADAIGGRYSVWSSIGFSVCLAVGYDHFSDMLEGGALMDEHFLTAPPEKNMPLIMGLLGVWYQNFLGATSYAVVPYCQRLGEFVDHLQQLDMESNGQTATDPGETSSQMTGPIVWGQTGTNGQHAFFQLFHQGMHLIPVDFIGTIEDRLSSAEHHRLLNANLIAQSEALMAGQSSTDLHQNYEGNRPSSVLMLDSLTPKTLGMLLALYEHRVFVQARIWGINPFDQWGVELGKKLANNILNGEGKHDPSTSLLLQKTGLAD
ncbi:MAG: glucose-6-phosphate isomerase [Candidatus Azotimanducaceae bacterium]|jgi:glucose-6-phosphate isomerase